MPSTKRIWRILDPGSLLLACLFINILVLPVMPNQHIKPTYAAFLSAIFFFSALSLDKNRVLLLSCAGILTLLLWVQLIVDTEFLRAGKYILEFIFLFVLVRGFISQLASKSAVSSSVFVDAVAGYLLLGFAYSLVVTALIRFNPGAFRFEFAGNGVQDLGERFANSNYYAFMTFSTAGYGDIVPVTAFAKSLSILISISGQLYVATVISMLISKYMSAESKQ